MVFQTQGLDGIPESCAVIVLCMKHHGCIPEIPESCTVRTTVIVLCTNTMDGVPDPGTGVPESTCADSLQDDDISLWFGVNFLTEKIWILSCILFKELSCMAENDDTATGKRQVRSDFSDKDQRLRQTKFRFCSAWTGLNKTHWNNTQYRKNGFYFYSFILLGKIPSFTSALQTHSNCPCPPPKLAGDPPRLLSGNYLPCLSALYQAFPALTHSLRDL